MVGCTGDRPLAQVVENLVVSRGKIYITLTMVAERRRKKTWMALAELPANNSNVITAARPRKDWFR
jgi:hypothetical protein